MSKSFRTIELSNQEFESGLRFLTVKSENLNGRGDICLYVPNVEKETNLPIYILLHGVYGSAWVWALKGGAHHTAKRLITEQKIKPAIVAMPSDGLWGDGSGYLPHKSEDFSKWIVEDVPLAIRENIHEAGVNSSLCIGGLSMGGYGAMCLGAGHPNVFNAISAHSAITTFEEMALFVEESLDSYSLKSSDNDVIDILSEHKENLPKLRFDCGMDDELIQGNRLLHRQLMDLKIPHIYEEYIGRHEWSYWQEHVEKTFLFFNNSI
ncbi:alpha/beta hydrolase [Flagellimonas sp.]|uniref:alpha/beta hydrolase n=1 Tax=Flagellimonas sp. TaxID=2058762 RepID=UPI003B51A5A0